MSDAAIVYKGLLVNEGSDGAQCLRYLHLKKAKDGKVVLVGQAWSPDVDSCKEEELTIPRRDPSKSDPDDFTAMKRLNLHYPETPLIPHFNLARFAVVETVRHALI